jgi:N-terminal glycosyl-hydrolase-114-associated domain/Galactose oxidase, central domain/Kelch motif
MGGSMSSYTSLLSRSLGRLALIPGVLIALALALPCDAQTAAWASAGNMTTARANHTATLLNDGTVLVAGGSIGATVLASAEIYNPNTNSWTLTGAMGYPRSGHTATLLSDGRVLVVGGGAGATAEIYDPSTATWMATGSLNAIRQSQTASLLQNGMVLVAGGCCTAVNVPGYTQPVPAALTSSELWNPSTGQWTLTGSMVNMHANHTATVLSNGSALVAGGTSLQFPPGPVTINAAEIYNPTSQTWAAVGGLITARYNATASLLTGDQVLVTGGDGGGCCSGLSSAEIYNPTTQAWQAMPAMSARDYDQAAAVFSGSSQALVTGGYSCCSSPNPTSTSAQVFDVTAKTWALTASMSQARHSHTLTILSDGTVLAVGGVNSSGGSDASAERFYPGAAPPQVTISSNVATMNFTVTGTGCSAGGYITPTVFTWTQGANCTVTVGPVSPYVFVSWSDGSTANPRTFVAPSTSTTYSFTVTQNSGSASSLSATSGTPQSTTVGTAFASPLVVTVDDSNGNPVGGAIVTFTAPSSGASGTFAGGAKTAITNSSGVATSAVFTANGTTGSYTVTAGVSGVSQTARFRLTNLANSSNNPASISATSGTPQSAMISSAFTSPFVVTVKNSSGTGVNGVTVTFSVPSSGASGTFAGGVSTATTNSSGVATSAVFTANTKAGNYTVTASVTGVSAHASFALTNTAGPAASITATSGTPQSATISSAFASPLTATVKDSGGNALSGVTVTFMIPTTGASGTFAGGVTTAITNSSGIAASAVFTANATTGSYAVTAIVGGVSTPASFALTNTAAGSQNGTITLVPSSYVTTQGSTGGQAVATSIDLLDESGTSSSWNKYVEFDGLYAGYQVFTLPTSIVPNSVTNIQIQVNYQGPATSSQIWTWQIYDWVHSTYVTVGTNAGAPDWGAWKLLTFSVSGTLSNYVRSSDGQVRVQLVSNNSSDSADIDYESVVVVY